MTDTKPDLAVLLTQCREAHAKMTPGEQWSLSQRGDTIVRRDTPDRMHRHPQTHLQMVPPEDAAGVVTLVRAFPQLADALDMLKEERETLMRDYQIEGDETPHDVIGRVLKELVKRGVELGRLRGALRKYEHCRHGCIDCFCVVEARAALALTETAPPPRTLPAP